MKYKDTSTGFEPVHTIMTWWLYENTISFKYILSAPSCPNQIKSGIFLGDLFFLAFINLQHLFCDFAKILNETVVHCLVRQVIFGLCTLWQCWRFCGFISFYQTQSYRAVICSETQLTHKYLIRQILGFDILWMSIHKLFPDILRENSVFVKGHREKPTNKRETQ